MTNKSPLSWVTFLKSCLRPERLREAVEPLSQQAERGKASLARARRDLCNVVVPGVAGARSTRAQVEKYNIALCQNIHHYMGPCFKSEEQNLRRILRPELSTKINVNTEARRQGKTLVASNVIATLLVHAYPGKRIRHYAKAQDQAQVMVIYVMGILSARKIAGVTCTKDSVTVARGTADPSTLHTASITEQERGKPCDIFTGDEFLDYVPKLFAEVGLGMVNPEDATLILFSTRKAGPMGGIATLAALYDCEINPDICGYNDMGVCQDCQNRLRKEFWNYCWHTKCMGGAWVGKSRKAAIIANIIQSLGLDHGVFERESLNIMSSDESYVIMVRNFIPLCFQVDKSRVYDAPFRIDIGVDLNGGGVQKQRDHTGMFAIIRGRDWCQIVGIGHVKITDLDTQAAVHVRLFITRIRERFQNLPIVVQIEAQPPGWASSCMHACSDIDNLFFIGRPGGANEGVGIFMTNTIKKLMALFLSARVVDGLSMSEKAVFMTNVETFKLAGGQHANTSDEYCVRKTEQEFSNAQYYTDPKTQLVTISGKRGMTDDSFCSALHCFFIQHAVENLPRGQYKIFRACTLHTNGGHQEVPPLSDTWLALLGVFNRGRRF